MAQAQTDELSNDELKKKALAQSSTVAPDGWDVVLNLGGSANFNFSNQNAASAGAGEEGVTFQFGFVVGVSGNYKSGRHRWQNALTLQQTHTKQPERSFRKSLDSLEFLSTYLYSFGQPSWLGPFARFRLNTQVLRSSYFNDTGAMRWQLESIEGGAVVVEDRPEFDRVEGGETRIVQTEPFEPLILRESAGMFANPFNRGAFTLDIKLGVGAQQILARDGRAFVQLRDDGGETVPVLREIERANDVGAEGEISMSGAIVHDVLNWRLSANAFLPLVSSADIIDDSDPDVLRVQTPVGVEFTNVTVTAGVSLQLSKWASLDYVFNLRRVLAVVQGVQIQHGVLLNAGFDLL